jgi:acyl carrier protein
VLRSYLSVDAGVGLKPDVSPLEYGLDSVGTVGLLLDLEERYAVTIPDDQLTRIASADIAGLWALLESAGAEWDGVVI